MIPFVSQGVSDLVYFIFVFKNTHLSCANSVGLDQTLPCVASDLGLHGLTVSFHRRSCLYANTQDLTKFQHASALSHSEKLKIAQHSNIKAPKALK